MTVVVNPLIGVVGIAGNAVNCAVLRKSGFSKPSNIFLFGLAVADLLGLLPAVDVAFMLTKFPKHIPPGYSYWEYDCTDNRLALFYLNVSRILISLAAFGQNASCCLCVIITIERLIAVFFPLKFTAIVRPKRAWLVVVLLYVFWTVFAFMFARKITFFFTYTAKYKTCLSTFYLDFDDAERLLDTVATWLSCYVSLGIVVISSILIGAKIKMANRRRAKMTSSNSASSVTRTTQTLMAVCVVFSITQMVRFPYAMFRVSFQDEIAYETYQMALTLTSNLNSASNFVIYVILNNKFRRIFLGLF
ncbi:unnamed protein product, partial [Lymnaea stagnalis]